MNDANDNTDIVKVIVKCFCCTLKEVRLLSACYAKKGLYSVFAVRIKQCLILVYPSEQSVW